MDNAYWPAESKPFIQLVSLLKMEIWNFQVFQRVLVANIINSGTSMGYHGLSWITFIHAMVWHSAYHKGCHELRAKKVKGIMIGTRPFVMNWSYHPTNHY